MYNRLFGMSCRPYYPNRPNRPNNNAVNRNPQPTEPKNDINSQQVQEDQKSSCKSSPANQVLIKSSDLGGIILPENTDKNATYIVASLNLDTYSYRNFLIHFNYSCNIATTSARMHLRFQLFKRGNGQTISTPVSSSLVYSRNENSGETNTFSFTACDCDSIGCSCCNYSVYIEIMSFDTTGTIMITNPVLIASIIENNSEIV
ncbi:DUF4489 domain-containing protein [Lacrimispora brassicae]